jgi:hypothetical protein
VFVRLYVPDASAILKKEIRPSSLILSAFPKREAEIAAVVRPPSMLSGNTSVKSGCCRVAPKCEQVRSGIQNDSSVDPGHSLQHGAREVHDALQAQQAIKLVLCACDGVLAMIGK